MNYDQITYKEDGCVSKIFLNRPAKLNAYTPDMGDEIIHAFRTANANKDIVAIALMGNGESFCAGADRDYLLGNKLSKSGLKIGQDEFISSFVKELSSTKKILIAGMKGACVGIGITMILPFDLRIAESNTIISFPFTKLGILPGLASTYYLPLLVGSNKAKELILCNAKLSSQEAKDIGLINQVVKEGQSELSIDKITSLYSSIDKNVLFAAKKAFNFNLDNEVQNAIKREQNLLKILRE